MLSTVICSIDISLRLVAFLEEQTWRTYRQGVGWPTLAG